MFSIHPLLFAALALALPATQAQTPAPDTNTVPPVSAIPTTPAIKYCSVFEQYRAFKDEEVGDWQKTNAAVMQAGGWRAYAREARQADPAPAKPDGKPGTTPAACPPGVRISQEGKP